MPDSSLPPVLLGCAACLASLCLGAGSAGADLASLRAEVGGGAAGGAGMFGEIKDEAFQANRGPLGYGAIVGGEVLFTDLWIEHNQYLDGGDISTWTQFMLGFDVEFGLGGKKSFHFDDAGNQVGGYDAWLVELGLGVGFGLGTGAQVEPPLDNSEVTDKGVLFETRARVAYRLTELLSLGVSLPVGFGYFTKSGTDAFANDVDNHYSGFGGQLFVNLRASLALR